MEYDGSDFYGWQIQPELRTVQGEMESAILRLTQENIRLTASGRTDTGVHALGQVVSFAYSGNLEADSFRRGLNALLPEDIRIVEALNAPEKFDARRSAVRRTYRYVISKTESALRRKYAWYPGYAFNLEPMRQAASYLIGTHDWNAFAKSDPDIKRMDSTVYEIAWRDFDHELYFEITAVRFFHSMIRFLIGTLMDVGRGKQLPGRIREILESGDIDQAGMKAPAHGLYLLKVDYPS